MALTRKGNHPHGDSQADLPAALKEYSAGGYPVEHWRDARCTCRSGVFRLAIDDDEGAAVRTCVDCGTTHPIGDSADYVDDADLQDCECPCGSDCFEVTIGVALYSESEDVKWVYIACRCPQCGLMAVYGDWKNEFEDYRRFLGLV